MSVHNIGKGIGDLLSVREVRDMLRQHPCDGYLIEAWLKDSFFKAMGRTSACIQCFDFANRVCADVPTIIFDVHDGVRRAISHLAGEGYRRIGLIGIRDVCFAHESQTAAYRQAMSAAGLDYDVGIRCSPAIGESMAATEKILAMKERPDAIYVSDDYIMDGVAQVLKMAGIRPGHDLGVISMSTADRPLSAGHDWSRMEFSREDFSATLIDTIVREVETGTRLTNGIALQPKWIPGQTHLKLGGS